MDLDVDRLRQPTLTIDRLGRRWVGLSTEHRLNARLQGMDQPDGCWVWSGYVRPDGYGVMGIYDRRTAAVHRLAYAISRGVDPGPLLVCHTCDNPPCCNPDHLFLGTTDDNMKDMARKSRSGVMKLSVAKVQELRERAMRTGETHRQLAQVFGIGHAQVGRILRRTRREMVPDGSMTRVNPPDDQEVS